MGMRKVGKKLLKLGEKAAKTLGKDGKKRVGELYAAAIEALEHALQKERAKTEGRAATQKGPAKRKKAAAAQPRRSETTPGATSGKRERTASRRSARVPRRPAAGPRATRRSVQEEPVTSGTPNSEAPPQA
jgi:hypothetical protein